MCGEREITIDVDADYIISYNISYTSGKNYVGSDFDFSMNIEISTYDGDLSSRTGAKYTLNIMKGDNKMYSIDDMKITSISVDTTSINIDFIHEPK